MSQLKKSAWSLPYSGSSKISGMTSFMEESGEHMKAK